MKPEVSGLRLTTSDIARRENWFRVARMSRHPRMVALTAMVAAVVCNPVARALDIVFDYTYDTSGFFSEKFPERRATLEVAARSYEAVLVTELREITPTPGNGWNLEFSHPGTGGWMAVVDPVLPANTIVVYVGARDFGGRRLGYADFSYSYRWRSKDWDTVFSESDSVGAFRPLGGGIGFDSKTNWHFDPEPETIEDLSGSYDFYTVAIHEIGHLLGFVGNPGPRAFAAKHQGGMWVGEMANQVFGGKVPLSADRSHWASDVEVGGIRPAFAGSAGYEERGFLTTLDLAALHDLGYGVKLPDRQIGVGSSPDGIELAWRAVVGEHFIIQRSLSGESWLPFLDVVASCPRACVVIESGFGAPREAMFRVVENRQTWHQR